MQAIVPYEFIFLSNILFYLQLRNKVRQCLHWDFIILSLFAYNFSVFIFLKRRRLYKASRFLSLLFSSSLLLSLRLSKLLSFIFYQSFAFHFQLALKNNSMMMILIDKCKNNVSIHAIVKKIEFNDQIFYFSSTSYCFSYFCLIFENLSLFVIARTWWEWQFMWRHCYVLLIRLSSVYQFWLEE